MSSEVERKIGQCEREFDIARGRVDELQAAVRSTENALDKALLESKREGLRAELRRFERRLESARTEMTSAHEALKNAWAMRSSSQSDFEVEGEVSGA
jgi:vacuolar-type H+-ATPase subunit D/Vma8